MRRGAAVLAAVGIAAGLVMQSPPTRGFAAAPAPRCGGDAVRECQLSLLTTQPDDGIQPLLDRFAEAQTSIDYAPFVFSSPRIAQALKDAKDRGVRVRVLLEVYPGDDGITAMDGGDMLANFGIAWRPTNQQYLLTHAKYAIIDSSQAFIWTFNSDEGDLSQKRDFGIVDEDPDDVTFVQALFDADWRLLRTPPIPEGFVVSPDNSNQALVSLVDSAQGSLDVYSERAEPSPLLDAIVRASRRGVRVRFLMDKPSGKQKAQAGLAAMRSSSIDVRSPQGPRVHAKLMIVDGERVFMGSQNVEDAPGEMRRELGMIFAEPSITDQVSSVFERDWGGAPSIR